MFVSKPITRPLSRPARIVYSATGGGIQYGDALLLQSGDYFLLESGDKLLFEAEEPPSAYDTDAQAYITLVEAADSQSLETGVKDAINAFVVGCKSDGIWDAIKAACIMAGARTLTGALQPLVGTAPTNNNFVSGDYDRKLGLDGDGTTKYLETGRLCNDDPQNDNHISVYVTTTAPGSAIGCTGTARTAINKTSTLYRYASRANTLTFGSSGSDGFAGISRSSSASYVWRNGGTGGTINVTSQPTTADEYLLWDEDGVSPFSNAVISFYSIGEALDLALLDTRVTSLMAQLAFAINTGLSPVGYSSETIDYVNAGYAAGGSLA